MERLATALDEFIRFQLRHDHWMAFAVFVIASALIGLAIVLLDYCSVALGRDSALNLTHGRQATPKAALLWMVGSALGASLGLLAHVFEPTPLAALLAFFVADPTGPTAKSDARRAATRRRIT